MVLSWWLGSTTTIRWRGGGGLKYSVEGTDPIPGTKGGNKQDRTGSRLHPVDTIQHPLMTNTAGKQKRSSQRTCHSSLVDGKGHSQYLKGGEKQESECLVG